MIRRKVTRIELKQEDIAEFEQLYQRRNDNGEDHPNAPMKAADQMHESQMRALSREERIRGRANN